ncbi:MAG: hypothetical protein AB8B47_13255 [Roseobacter sp.]
MAKLTPTKAVQTAKSSPTKTAPKSSPTRVAKPTSNQTTKVTQAVSRGQMQGAATSTPKKMERSNFLFSKSFVDKAMTWKYKNFDSLRQKIHKTLAKDPKFLASKHATPNNLKRMEKGKAPLAPKNERLGKRVAMEVEHGHERQDGVNEMRVDNTRLVSPLKHKMKIMRKYHQAAGTEMPKDLRDPVKYKKPKVQEPYTPQKLSKPLKLK